MAQRKLDGIRAGRHQRRPRGQRFGLGNPVDSPPMQRLIVETALPATADRGELTDRFDAELIAGGTDTFFFPAVRLGLQGVWNVSVIVRRAGVDDLRASFTVDTSQAGIPPPRVSSDVWRLPRIPVAAWGLFALAVFVAIGGVVGVKRLPGLEPLAATLILTMIVLIAAGGIAQIAFDPREQAQTMTAFIGATGIGDVATGSIEYKTIFAVGLTLFVITFVMNMVAIRLVRKYRQIYE